jgi:hypothetical protein
MVGRPRADSDARQQYWGPRGSIFQQLLRQPRPGRHDYSLNLAPLPLSLIPYSDLPLHPDMLDLFRSTPHAARIHPPYVFRPADAHGWAILNDASLLPTVDDFGLVTDGGGRILGQVLGGGFPAAPSQNLPILIDHFSTMYPGNPLPPETLAINPWSPSRQQPSNFASPKSTIASLASRAETAVESSNESKEANANHSYLPVYDRNFDVGVSPL